MNKISKITCSLLLASACLNAATLKESVENTLNNNSNIKSIKENNEAFRQYIDEEKGGYLPTIDLQITGESKKTESKLENNPRNDESDTGFNATLTLEQMLYDGGLTSSRVDEAISRELSNRLSNDVQIDNTIVEGIRAYLDLVKYEQRVEISKLHVKKNEEYLTIAKSNEQINGNSLDTFEVKAKLHLAKVDLLREQENYENALSTYKRVTGTESTGAVCLPKYNKDLIPAELESLVQISLKNNKEIKAQLAKIEENRAKLNQEGAAFLPSLNLFLTGTADDQLIESNTETNIYSAKVVLNYNLFNGGSDSSSKAREMYFLSESQASLDEVSNVVVENANNSFTSYKYIADRIAELNGYLSSNEEILDIYNLQFQDGTRTFVDVLDKETELYNARVQYINENVDLANEFYNMMNLTGKLQNNISGLSSDVCNAKPIVTIKDVKEDNLGDIANELNIDTPKEEVKTEIKSEPVSGTNLIDSLKNEFSTELNSGKLVFDEKLVSFRFASEYASLPLTKNGIVLSENLQNDIKDFLPRLKKVLENYDYESININGYSSTDYSSAKSDEENYKANLAVSYTRANSVLNFIKSQNLESPKMIASGKSYANPVVDENGKENSKMSKRVEISISTK